MLSAERPNARLRAGLAVAFALVWTVLVMALAGASPASLGPRSYSEPDTNAGRAADKCGFLLP
jgi:hypothetical protein